MYAQLGNIQFSAVKGFTELTSTQETNLAEHALIEGKPKLQRVGTNLTTVELAMFFDVSFCNPQAEIDALNDSRESAEIMPLIMGNGRYEGTFVIQSVEKTTVTTADDGTLLQAEVAVTLLEYANNDLNAAANSGAIGQAFATLQTNPSTFIPEIVAISEASQASEAFVSASACINSTSETLSGLAGVVDLYRPKAEAIVRDMLIAGDSLGDLLELINADPASEMYAVTRELALKASETITVTADVAVEAEALISDIDAGNTVGIASKVASLVNRGTELKTRSVQLAQKAAAFINQLVIQ